MSVLDLLEQQWARPAAEPAAAWRLREVCELAGGARSLDDVEQFVQMADAAAVDAVLAALVARAVHGDRLAARVLLQLLLPGIRRLARTWWAPGDAEARATAAVAAVYERIRRYPLARRPHRIATNILAEAEHDLRHRPDGPPGAAALLPRTAPVQRCHPHRGYSRLSSPTQDPVAAAAGQAPPSGPPADGGDHRGDLSSAPLRDGTPGELEEATGGVRSVGPRVAQAGNECAGGTAPQRRLPCRGRFPVAGRGRAVRAHRRCRHR